MKRWKVGDTATILRSDVDGERWVRCSVASALRARSGAGTLAERTTVAVILLEACGETPAGERISRVPIADLRPTLSGPLPVTDRTTLRSEGRALHVECTAEEHAIIRTHAGPHKGAISDLVRAALRAYGVAI